MATQIEGAGGGAVAIFPCSLLPPPLGTLLVQISSSFASTLKNCQLFLGCQFDFPISPTTLPYNDFMLLISEFMIKTGKIDVFEHCFNFEPKIPWFRCAIQLKNSLLLSKEPLEKFWYWSSKMGFSIMYERGEI